MHEKPNGVSNFFIEFSVKSLQPGTCDLHFVPAVCDEFLARMKRAS